MVVSKNKHTNGPAVCMDYASLYWQMPFAFDSSTPSRLLEEFSDADGMSQKELEDYMNTL